MQEPSGVEAVPGNPTVDPGLSLDTDGVHEAILTFDHPPSAVDVVAIEASGVVAHRYNALPMMAVQGTAAQLRGLLGLPGLQSIYLDRLVESYTGESELTAQPA